MFAFALLIPTHAGRQALIDDANAVDSQADILTHTRTHNVVKPRISV